MNLENLSKQELLKLRDKVDLQLYKLDKKIDGELQIFYNIINKVVSKQNKGDYPDIYVIRKTSPKIFHSIESLYFAYGDWLENVLKMKLNHASRKDSYSVLCIVISKVLRDMNLPLTLKTFLNVAKDFPNHFSSQFPGYIKSGVMSFILRKTHVR